MNYNIIKRNGYGSNFNIIYINYKKTLIKKKTINLYGIEKIKCEINFFNFINDNKIEIKIPKIYYTSYNTIIMEYIKENKYNIDYFDIILNEIMILHLFNNITINKNYYKQLLFEETIIKIKKRYNQIQYIINNYNNIIYVNNIKILNIFNIIDKLNIFFNTYINDLDIYLLHPIHGDLQYNNIIINNNNIYFIDPKGIFGSSHIYGIKEYDIAKMYFSLSGYYEFDNMDFNNIDIINDNNLKIDFINIPDFNKHKKNSYYNNCNIKFIKYLFISIWLSNAHIFINNPFKLIYSYYISIYFSTLLL
jgi:tRNA A-37 threonylcarbamoyl transferase component Bud32